MKEFDESKHPRDETGKFTEGAGTEAEKEKLAQMGIAVDKKEKIYGSKEEKALDRILTENKEIKGHNLTQVKDVAIIKEQLQDSIQLATTIEEAETLAKDTLGIVANYKGIDIEVANEMNAAFKRGIDICPAIKDELKMVGNAQKVNKALKAELTQYYEQEYRRLYPNSTSDWYTKMAKKSARLPSVSQYEIAQARKYASSNPTVNIILEKYNGVFVNEQKGKDKESFKNSLKQCVQSGYHPIGCDTIASVFDHEVAHVIDNVLQLKSNIEMRELFHKYSRQEIEQGLSRYAIEENKIGEFIAEGWAEYCNNPNPRKIAVEIGKIIEKEIR